MHTWMDNTQWALGSQKGLYYLFIKATGKIGAFGISLGFSLSCLQQNSSNEASHQMHTIRHRHLYQTVEKWK